MRFGWTIFRYLIGAVLPYFVFSWLLLSVVLFVQQASRFSDIFFSVNIPAGLIWQLSFALVPNVIAFTCPMAALVGVIIGLTKMQADSELVAIRAAGVGNLTILLPILALGVLLSLFAFFVNLKGVPLAAGVVRQVALRSALHKLESPIEPGVFNTEVAGYTIYVKEGDVDNGTWKNIFIYSEDEKSGTVRLITSSRGRIDSTNENSELVLENAISSTFVNSDGAEKFYSERIGEVRYAVKTKRSEIVERLNSSQLTPDELGLAQLSNYAQSKDGRERTEAELLWQRRITLSITPVIFCLFGAALVLRFNRTSRGFAIVSALLSLIVYYMLAFLGEQLARTGRIGVFTAALFPIIASVAMIAWLLFAGRLNSLIPRGRVRGIWRSAGGSLSNVFPKTRSSVWFADLTTGLRDFDLLSNLIRFYILALAFLGSIFIIFTAFELWKFAGTIDNGVSLLAKYLFYLSPFIYLQLAPSAAMIAILATYVIKSRQNEVVTWISAGQSVYRLLLPCIIFATVLGLANWQIQERIYPRSNRIQDDLRSLIRNRGEVGKRTSKYWFANDRRIYSFDLDDASDNANDATVPDSISIPVKNLSVYEFTADNTRLQSVYRVSTAEWRSDRVSFVGGAERLDISDQAISKRNFVGGELEEKTNPLQVAQTKPSHLNSDELKARIDASGSDVERRAFGVALAKKYAAAFLPFIIGLFTAPFALSLKRTGKAATTGYAVGLWLLFMGTTSVFEQLGLNGTIPVATSVWGPLFLFSMLGVYLLSRIRT